MLIQVFKSKIHRVTVTQSELDYEGSVTIDEHLLWSAGIYEYEQVHIWNVTTGTRLITYALKGDFDSGVVCVNGAGAHLNNPGDIIIIASFGAVDQLYAKTKKPTVVHVDGKNKITRVTHG